MADPKAENNVQHFLAKIAGAEETAPVPQTNVEHYLAKIAGEDVTIPDEPNTTEEYYLDKIAEGGVGVEVVPLNVTENDTYTAPSGQAFNPVTVNVPGATVWGPYGPHKAGDSLDSAEKQALTFGSLYNRTSVAIVTDGERYASLVSYDGKTYIAQRVGTAGINVEFSITLHALTITSITGADELTWYRISPALPTT